VGEELLAAQVTGKDRERRGNRDPRYAPQGCYPCAGVERWIAISVTSDDEWRTLVAHAGLPPAWGGMQLAERQARHDEIDARLAVWTRAFTPADLMARLQATGVIATEAVDGRALVESPHLAVRDFWARLDHPDVGYRMYPGTAIRLSDTPIQYRRPAPTLGQHNNEILRDELGATDAELDQLRSEFAIAEIPPR
jgi:benzylsuccinate CoA-transferase BbsF subunit